MNGQRPTWLSLPAARRAAAEGNYGMLLRLARIGAGLTLEDAGRRAGYSAATLSRLERGVQPLSDMRTLRRLAAVFAIPPAILGLADPPNAASTSAAADAARLPERSMKEGRVRRRDFLGSLTGLAVGTVITDTADVTRDLASGLEDVLLGRSTVGGGSPPGGLRAAMMAAKADFQASRYRVLADTLPRLLTQADNDPTADAAVVAELYNTATHVLIKLEVVGHDWITADRALTAARASGDPAVIANVTRNLVTLYRRAARYADAEQLALNAADQLTIGRPDSTAAHLSLYGMLLCNAGYAAAQAGARARAVELLDHAAEVATRLGGDANAHWTAFGPTNVISHRISAAFALGDAGTAIHHASTVNPGAIRLPERQSRFWVDVARAYQQWGKPAQCYQALITAERLAPEEVRSRPTVRTLASTLLATPRRAGMNGVRDFAIRVGVQA